MSNILVVGLVVQASRPCRMVEMGTKHRVVVPDLLDECVGTTSCRLMCLPDGGMGRGGGTGNRNGNQSPVCGSCWGRGGGGHHHMYAWFCFLGPLWGVEGEASYVMSSRVMPDGQYCIAVSRPRLSVRCEQHVIWRRMVSW